VEAKSRDIHVLTLTRYFQQLQDMDSPPGIGGTDPACRSGAMNFFTVSTDQLTGTRV